MRVRMLGILISMTMAAVSFAGCGEGGETTSDKGHQETLEATEGKLVGLSMPTQVSERWIRDAAAMKQSLENKGYQVQVQFAENDAQLQTEQLRQFMEDGALCLVVAAAEPDQLSQALSEAKEQSVPVIAYDRLLQNTDAMSYYATFDSRGIGRQIGNYIAKTEELEKLQEAGQSRTIEFFMGAPNDDNGQLLYEGVMEVLKPYLESGTLKCLSGKTSLEETGIQNWSQEKAQKKCQKLLSKYYQEQNLDIACTVFDGFAYGIQEALSEAGYGIEKDSRQWPLVTGQDAELMAVKNMLDGYQAMSVYKNTSLLAETCADLVEACLTGNEPTIQYHDTYDNGVQKVKAYLCKTEVVDRNNYRKLLIESGYYSEDDLK